MAIPFLVMLFLTTLLSYILAPKPPRGTDTKPENLQFPQSSQWIPVIRAYGRVCITAPNTLWSGVPSDGPITRPIQVGRSQGEFIQGKGQIIGYTYHLGLQLGVCLRSSNSASLPGIIPPDYSEFAFEDIALGGISLAQHIDELPISVSGTVVDLDIPEFYGAVSSKTDRTTPNSKSLKGALAFYCGEFTQGIDSYLAAHGSIPSGECPAYRGQAYLVFRDVQFGDRPNIGNISIVVRSYTLNLVNAGGHSKFTLADDQPKILSGSQLFTTVSGPTAASLADTIISLTQWNNADGAHPDEGRSGDRVEITGLAPDGTPLTPSELKIEQNPGISGPDPTQLGALLAAIQDAFDAAQPGAVTISLEPDSNPALIGTRITVTCLTPGENSVRLKLAFFPKHNHTFTLGYFPDNSGGDANPAEVVYDLIINVWGGAGIPLEHVNLQSFVDASLVLAEEGNGCSVQLTTTSKVETVITDLLKQMDALLYMDAATQKITLKLIREDYDPDTIPSFDESGFEIVEVLSFRIGQWQNTFNQVRIQFGTVGKNLQNATTDEVATAQDMSNVAFQQRLRSGNFSYPYVTQPGLAAKLAARDLAVWSIPLPLVQLLVNRTAWAARPGDVFKWGWSRPDQDGTMVPWATGMILRIQRVDVGKLYDGRIRLECTEDRFAAGVQTFSNPPDSGFVHPDNHLPLITERHLIEAPYWVNTVAQQNESPVNLERSHLYYLALNPGGHATGFDVRVSNDFGDHFAADGDNLPFAEIGELLNDYPGTTAFVDLSDTLILTDLSDASVLQTVTETQVRHGRNLLIIQDISGNDEVVGFLDFTDNLDGTYTLHTVARGLLDTVPASHVAGTRVWFANSVGLDVFGDNADVQDDEINVQYVTRAGVYGRVSPVLDDLQLVQRPTKPLPPAHVEVEGSNDPGSLGSTDIVTVTWRRRDRRSDQIMHGNDPDQSQVEYGVVYAVEGKLDSDSVWTVLDALVDGITTDVDLTPIGGPGAAHIRVRCYNQYVDPASRSYEALQHPTVPVLLT